MLSLKYWTQLSACCLNALSDKMQNNMTHTNTPKSAEGHPNHLRSTSMSNRNKPAIFHKRVETVLFLGGARTHTGTNADTKQFPRVLFFLSPSKSTLSQQITGTIPLLQLTSKVFHMSLRHRPRRHKATKKKKKRKKKKIPPHFLPELRPKRFSMFARGCKEQRVAGGGQR